MSDIKIGQKRTEPKRYNMKRSTIKQKSNKRKHEDKTYRDIVEELTNKCNCRSELSGDMADWRTEFIPEPHHIDGREGKRFIDPFNIIMITRSEHDEIHLHNTPEKKQELLAFIKPIRIEQGYKPEDYE